MAAVKRGITDYQSGIAEFAAAFVYFGSPDVVRPSRIIGTLPVDTGGHRGVIRNYAGTLEPPALTATDHPTLFAGIDVGGTNIKLGLVDDEGREAGSTQFPTRQEAGPADAVARIGQALAGLLERHRVERRSVAAVGLGTPGTMDIPGGMILEPPNLPAWRHYPIRRSLEDMVGLPVVFTNDATAAAYGEFWIGRGRGCDSLALFTLGTGVGGGLIVDGRAIQGAHSVGAEFGHFTVDTGRDARRCSCGMPGHLEAYASATALVERFSELSRQQSGEKVSARRIAELASQGDAIAGQAVSELGEFLARGIAIVAYVADPQMVLLGGAMNFGGPASAFGQQFLHGVRQRCRELVFPVVAAHMHIEFAGLGNNAGWIGAAGWARAQWATMAGSAPPEGSTDG